MFFSIKNNNNSKNDIKNLKFEILNEARRRILFYPMGPNEVQLNKYLKENYKKSFKVLCMLLLKNINFNTDSTNTAILNFTSTDLDKLAQLITYGTGVIPGSKILQFAFDQFGGNN